jgi:hypothetical protein
MQRISTGLIVLLTLAATSTAPLGQEQDPQQPRPTFRTRVDLVRVDVTVVGQNEDEILADLRAADFEIEEDGVPQKVETLQFVRLDGTRTGNTEESLPIRSPDHAAVEAARDDVRVFAIFLDDYHVDKKPHITLPLRQALRHLVEQFGPNDLVALMDPLTPLSALEFTRSRDDLQLKVAAFEGRRGEIFPVKSVLEEGQLGSRNLPPIAATSRFTRSIRARSVRASSAGRIRCSGSTTRPGAARSSTPTITGRQSARSSPTPAPITCSVTRPRGRRPPTGSSTASRSRSGVAVSACSHARGTGHRARRK